jgi:hypothetical protein
MADDTESSIALGAEDPMAGAYQDLDQLAMLPTNWDSYGGGPPSECARAVARELLEAITKRFRGAASDRIEPVTVGGLPGSGVLLEWQDDVASLEVDIRPDGVIGYLFVDRRGGERQTVEGDAVSTGMVLDRLATILATRS